MTFTVADDGESGTNIVCDDCGEAKCFYYSGTTEATAEEIEDCYLAWADGLCEGAAATHKCNN